MASTKRIPKRSIIGCKVCVECEDRVWRHGTVLGLRSKFGPDGPESGQMFSVKMEHSSQVTDHSEASILGPGFLSCLPPGVTLVPGQHVYITHNGREVEGQVRSHHTQQDIVQVDVKEVGTIVKKLEEIRLLESRKSARLVNTDTDFSLLADFNIVEQRKLAQESSLTPAYGLSVPVGQQVSRRRLHSMSDFHDRKRQKNIDQERREAKRRQRSERQTYNGGSMSVSVGIDVPGAGLSSSGSRKRRTSESRGEVDSGYGSSFGSGFFKTNEENLKECTAAMVLMNLSVSPRDRWRDGGYSDISSPPPTTPRPSPAPSLSHIHLSEDEEPYKRSRTSTNIQYQCTWRGCGLIDSCQTNMEKHVRVHLGLPDPPPGTDYGGEEDFYYTEIEPDDLTMTMEMDPTSDSGCSSSSNDGMNITYKFKSQSSPTNASTSSKQPESENYVRILPNINKSSSSSLASSVPTNFGSSHPLGDHIGMARPSYEAPTTIYLVNTLTTPNKAQLQHNNDHIYNSSSWQGKKLVSIVPRPDTSPKANIQSDDSSPAPFVFKSTQSGMVKSDKKCRKVYGIDQKELWCTQCKWKKACGRFT